MPGALRDAHVAVVKKVGDKWPGPHVTLALITEGGEGGGEGGGDCIGTDIPAHEN
jgi:hypothetical protein